MKSQTVFFPGPSAQALESVSNAEPESTISEHVWSFGPASQSPSNVDLLSPVQSWPYQPLTPTPEFLEAWKREH